MGDETTEESSWVRYETPHGTFWTRPNDFVNTQFEARGGHQRSELGMLLSLVREGDVVFDVGGHIGTFTVPLARAVGDTGRVHTFEPVPESFRLLGRNVETNEVADRVTLHHVIVTDKPGAYRVSLSAGHTSAAHFALADDDAPGAGLATETLHLDTWARDVARLERLDVMKIDTEGMELRVLRSARGLIERFRPIVMAEMSEEHLRRQGDSVADVGRFLSGFGYHFFRNLGSRHATDERFSLARLFSPTHVSDLYDLVAVHPASDRYPTQFDSPWSAAAAWAVRRARSAPGGVLRRLRGG